MTSLSSAMYSRRLRLTRSCHHVPNGRTFAISGYFSIKWVMRVAKNITNAKMPTHCWGMYLSQSSLSIAAPPSGEDPVSYGHPE